MRYLRMLTNSVIGGALSSAYLTVLVLHLNPQFPLSPSAVGALLLALGLSYGVNITAVFYGLIVMRQLVANEVLSPGWMSVRVSSWLAALAAGGGTTLMWLNLRSYASVLPPNVVTQMTAASAMMTAATAVFLLIAVAHFGRRGG